MNTRPLLSAIVAMDHNCLIGKQNALPWHVPADLQYFKAVTMGKPIVMGRKTWDSIGRPLPGRDNIVISGHKTLQLQGAHVVSSIDAAIEKAMALQPDLEEIMFMGGVTIYEQILPRLHRLYMTYIEHSFEGDAWFPKFNRDDWHELSCESHRDEKQEFTYHFLLLEKNDHKVNDDV